MASPRGPGPSRTGVLVLGICAAASGLVVAVVVGVVLVLRALAPAPDPHCFDEVRAIAAQIDVRGAGRVRALTVQDTGGVTACAHPQYDAILDGTAPAGVLRTRLADLGWEAVTPRTWTRTDGARVFVGIQEGTTQVVIDGP